MQKRGRGSSVVDGDKFHAEIICKDTSCRKLSVEWQHGDRVKKKKIENVFVSCAFYARG